MKKFFILLLSFTVLCSSFAFAQEIFLSKTNAKTHVKIVKEEFNNRDSSYIQLHAHMRSVWFDIIDTPQGKFARTTVDGFQSTRVAGSPELPVANRLVEVPINAKVSVEILSKVEQEYSLNELGVNYPIYPTQPSARRDITQKDKHVPSAFQYKSSSYKKKYAKSPVASIKELGVFHNYRLCLVQISMSNYNPLDKKIKLYSDVEIKINIEELDLDAARDFKQRYASSAFDRICQSSVLTSKTLASFAKGKKDSLKYLIIADSKFRGELQRYIDHKVAMGNTVVAKYTDEIGSSKSSIRNAIKGEYDNPKDGVAPTFLLIVGDRAEVPAYEGTEGSYVTDLNYSAIKGDDYLPDMISGRFSASTVADLAPQIDKTIAYESGNLPSYDFLKKVLLVAGWDSYWAKKRGYPHIRYGLREYFNTAGGYTQIEEHTFLSSASHQNESQIRQKASGGVGFFNYTAHGTETDFHDPHFDRDDVNGLSTPNAYPLVIGNCCLTNSFEVGACFGETWMRAPNGAIGFIGGSSYTYWDEDIWWGIGQCALTSSIDQGTPPAKSDTQTGAYDTAFGKLQHFSNGGVMLAGNLAVQEADSQLTKYYFEVYHFMGDPGVKAYWASPLNPPSKK